MSLCNWNGWKQETTEKPLGLLPSLETGQTTITMTPGECLLILFLKIVMKTLLSEEVMKISPAPLQAYSRITWHKITLHSKHFPNVKLVLYLLHLETLVTNLTYSGHCKQIISSKLLHIWWLIMAFVSSLLTKPTTLPNLLPFSSFSSVVCPCSLACRAHNGVPFSSWCLTNTGKRSHLVLQIVLSCLIIPWHCLPLQ